MDLKSKIREHCDGTYQVTKFSVQIPVKNFGHAVVVLAQIGEIFARIEFFVGLPCNGFDIGL